MLKTAITRAMTGNATPLHATSLAAQGGVRQPALSPTAPDASSSNVKIALRHLTKVFDAPTGDVFAVQDINLEIPEGQFCCIVGPSGCGKTTVLRILAGLEQHSSGECHIRRSSKDRPINSMVFQEQSIFPWMNVRDNIGFGLQMRRVDRRTRDEVVDYYLRKVGLTEFAAAYPHQLSGGMRQRVSVARAFATDPEVLLMDEPFAALDEQNKILMQEELLRIWEERRRTVVFITHSIDEAVVLGDMLVVMSAHPGRIKATIPVPFPRPRHVFELKAQPEFGRLTYHVWELLREEVLKAAPGGPRA
jgi:NitT/TauT family transport system ATP-binding protein